MKYVLLTLFFTATLWAQDRGYIDMHGGKKEKLINSKSNFSNDFSMMGNIGIKQKNIKKKSTQHKVTTKANKKNEKL